MSTELGRLLGRVSTLIEEFVRQPNPSPERVHQLHRAMRRLRVGLDLWGPLLPAKDRASVAVLAGRVKRLARLVGQVRDRDIVLQLLDRSRPRGATAVESRHFHQFWGRLRDDSRTGRELLRAFLTTERDDGLLLHIGEALARVPRATASAGLTRLLAAENHARHEKVRRAHRRASARPTSERLHRLRIRLRQLRYVSDLTRTVAPTAAHPIPVSFRQLQDRLGKLHDLDVALATLDPDVARSPWAADLRQLRRRVRVAARRELDRLAVLAKRRTGSLA
ncbi:MAG: CHAD domain-containing protein, partial [Thermoplasmata archaeon]